LGSSFRELAGPLLERFLADLKVKVKFLYYLYHFKNEESVEYKKLEELLVEHGASRSAFSQMMKMAQKPQRTDGIAGVFNGILQQSLWQQAQSDQDDDSLGPSDEED
jgi:hypothetical protein